MELQGAALNADKLLWLPLLAAFFTAFITRPKPFLSALISWLSTGACLYLAAAIFYQRWEAPHLAAMTSVYSWVQTAPGAKGINALPVGFMVDNLTAVMLVMVCFIGLLIQIYSYSYISVEIGHFPNQGPSSVSRFFACLNLFLFSMLGLVLSASTVQIYIFWELVGLCSYLLIGFWYFKSSAAAASKKAFVVTKFADLGFLLGVLSLGAAAGTFVFPELLGMQAGQVSQGLLNLGLILLFCGAIGKSAQFPLHIWLPDAMEGPTPVSALIHAATMVAAGVYLVARCAPLYAQAPLAADFVAWTGAITAILAASMALVQNDIKKILAYSTVSQLGFMLTALGAGATAAGVFHLVTHAFFKALLFLGSGAVIVACHSNDIFRMGGLRKALPFTHAAFAVGCLALAGVAPFSGFWSKDEILAGVAEHSYALLAILVFTAFLTAFYVGRLYFVAFPGAFRGADHDEPGHGHEHRDGHQHDGDHAALPHATVGGPVPPAHLPEPLQPSLAVFNMQPFWTEARVGKDAHEYPAECLGALAEHAPDHAEPHEVSPLMYVPLLILALFAFGLGFVGTPWSNYFGPFATGAHGAHGEHAPNIGLMLGSLVVALAGLGTAAVLFAKDPVAGEIRFQKLLGPLLRPLQQKWYFDHVWAWLLAHLVYFDAKVVGSFDERGVDRVVYGVGDVTYDSGEMLRREQTGQLQRYALMLVMGFLVMLFAVALVEFFANMVPGAEWLRPRVPTR